MPTGPAADVSAGVLVVVIGFWAYCLYDFTKTDEVDMRTYSKQVWILILVLTNIFGSLMWLYLGRPRDGDR